MKLALDQMVEEAKARVLFHAWACEPILEDGRRRAHDTESVLPWLWFVAGE